MIKPKFKQCQGPCGLIKPIFKNYKGPDDTKAKKYCKECWYSMEPPKQLKQTTSIKKVSAKKSKKDRAYSALRQVFLEQHPLCEIGLQGCLNVATEVHHRQGREGDLHLDTTKWAATCHSCHTWITEHSAEAIEMGFSISKHKVNENDTAN